MAVVQPDTAIDTSTAIAATRRDRLWHAVAEGEAKVVVGARSALFLPFSSLGLIDIDLTRLCINALRFEFF